MRSLSKEKPHQDRHLIGFPGRSREPVVAIREKCLKIPGLHTHQWKPLRCSLQEV